MGLFNNNEKEMRKQFQAQADIESAKSDLGVFQQMQEQGSIAYDPQVSALILKQGDFFLKWNIDTKTGYFMLDKTYEGFVEPGGMEPFCFLNEKNGDGEFLNDIDSTLMSILDYGDKYSLDVNVRNSWNKIARKRMRYLNNSRTLEGKAQQLSKSQIIKSSGQITRFNNPKEDKKDKLFGVL